MSVSQQASGPPAPAPVGRPRPRPRRAVPVAPAAGPTTVTVVSGDSLWLLAEQCYGAGADWQVLASANLGHVMNDGTRFTTPNLIYPGWELIVPALETATVAPPPPAAAPAAPSPAAAAPAVPDGPPAPSTSPARHGTGGPSHDRPRAGRWVTRPVAMALRRRTRGARPPTGATPRDLSPSSPCSVSVPCRRQCWPEGSAGGACGPAPRGNRARWSPRSRSPARRRRRT